MTKQERAVRTRNRLIEAAAELFHRDGFEMTSLAMVTARARVSNGALHFHFATKADLAQAVAEVAAARLGRIVDAGAGGGGWDRELQRLIDVTHAFVRNLDSDVVLRAGFDLCSVRERAVAGANLWEAWHAWVRQALATAETEGGLAPGISAQDAAAAVVAVTVGFEALGAQDARWLSPDPLTRFWHLMLPALAPAPERETLTAAGSAAVR
ncbi:ScbR family autoregulator-binding transcription factor [Streptomyces sp. NPDC058257]|uniref:ScbR family autoregulator-binding transcription factor n=1 Tax=Streptomyces sp. NPDC058257 TaxID=3346409 RepID=UPI0036EC5DE4